MTSSSLVGMTKPRTVESLSLIHIYLGAVRIRIRSLIAAMEAKADAADKEAHPA